MSTVGSDSERSCSDDETSAEEKLRNKMKDILVSSSQILDCLAFSFASTPDSRNQLPGPLRGSHVARGVTDETQQDKSG